MSNDFLSNNIKSTLLSFYGIRHADLIVLVDPMLTSHISRIEIKRFLLLIAFTKP